MESAADGDVSVGVDDSGVTDSGDDGNVGQLDDLTISTNKVIMPGSIFLMTGNSVNPMIPLYNEVRTVFRLRNIGASQIQVESIELMYGDDSDYSEFELLDSGGDPLMFSPISLSSDDIFTFSVRFVPVYGGIRESRLVVKYSDNKSYAIVLRGNGTPDSAVDFGGAHESWATSIGGLSSNESGSSLVLDRQGNSFIVSNVTNGMDRLSSDVFFAKINGDGTSAWIRQFRGSGNDYIRDPLQDQRMGGGSEMIDIDEQGFIYGALSHSTTRGNQYPVILKIRPDDAKLQWAKLWGKAQLLISYDNIEPYALDVSRDRVFVTGAYLGDEKLYVISMMKVDGSLAFSYSMDLFQGKADRGTAIRADGVGNAYVGGVSDGRAVIIRLSDVYGSTPQVDWVKRIDYGARSGIVSLDVDREGNGYALLERRERDQKLSAFKINQSGEIVWIYEWNDLSGSELESGSVIRVVGDKVIVGGRTSIAGFDELAGDGLILRFSRFTGQLDWAAQYFTGGVALSSQDARVKGVAVSEDGNLYVMSHVSTALEQATRLRGKWYDAGAYWRLTVGEDQPRVADVTELVDWGRIVESTVSVRDAFPEGAIGYPELTGDSNDDWLGSSSVIGWIEPGVDNQGQPWIRTLPLDEASSKQADTQVALTRFELR